MSDYNYRRLPRSIQARMEDLVRALKDSLGEDLRSVIVHGSVVRDDWHEGESDIDVIIVLKQSSRALLEKLTEPLAIARAAARAEAMILVEDEIARAADVFPLLYDDVKRHHLVLYGGDPFADLTVDRRHHRLRIAQELRDLKIRLRRAVIDAGGHKPTLAAVVTRKVRQARFPLRALLAMLGISCADDLEAILTKAGRRLRVDTHSLLRTTEKTDEAIDALAALLASAVSAVDTLEDEVSP
jgi:predicted nucleotidyltransferase